MSDEKLKAIPPLEGIEEWCGGIDNIQLASSYNLSGTHLKEILIGYKTMYEDRPLESKYMAALKEAEKALELALPYMKGASGAAQAVIDDNSVTKDYAFVEEVYEKISKR